MMLDEFIKIGISSFKDILNALTVKSRTKNIHKQQLFRELRHNLSLLNHRKSKDCNRHELIKNLDNTAIDTAYKDGFNFNHLQRGKIDQSLVYTKRCKRYIDWDSAKMMAGIDTKIEDLKRLEKLYPSLESPSISISRRLDNLYHQMTLMAIFIAKD